MNLDEKAPKNLSKEPTTLNHPVLCLAGYFRMKPTGSLKCIETQDRFGYKIFSEIF